MIADRVKTRLSAYTRHSSRPCQPKDQRYQSLYLFGAVCPALGTGAALALP